MQRLGSRIVLLICWLLGPAAHADKRIALLIGNQGYSAEIGKLANPHNDIALLEKTLKGLQFEVATVHDAGLAVLHQAVNAYARRVKAAGPGAIAFFYYAGHGASDAGTNYLIPVDVKSAEEGDLWDVSLRLTEITGKLRKEAGNATHFVVFDACRNELKLRKAGSRTLVQARGFVPVTQEAGMLIAYATAEGELASDVGAGAGPYSSVLAEEIVKPGVEAVTMFRNVQLRVKVAIGQEPWIGFSALGKVHLAGPVPDAQKVTSLPSPPPAPTRLSEAAEAWTVTKDTQSIAALEAFIRRFGDTYYGDLAMVRLAELKQAEAATQAAQAVNKEPPSEKGRKQPSSSISGHWKWTQECQTGSYRGHLQISLTGENRFTGRITQEVPQLSGDVFDGRLQGNQISFKATLNILGTSGFETWRGSLSVPARMQGTATTPRVGTCTWTASRE